MATTFTTARASISVTRYVGPMRDDGKSRIRFLINAEPGKHRAHKAFQADIGDDEMAELLILLTRARITDDADGGDR